MNTASREGCKGERKKKTANEKEETKILIMYQIGFWGKIIKHTQNNTMLQF